MDMTWIELMEYRLRYKHPIATHYLLQLMNNENDEIREAVYERVPRELVPPERLAEYDEFHVKRVMAA